MSTDEILSAVLPEDYADDIPTSYNCAGHVGKWPSPQTIGRETLLVYAPAYTAVRIPSRNLQEYCSPPQPTQGFRAIQAHYRTGDRGEEQPHPDRHQQDLQCGR